MIVTRNNFIILVALLMCFGVQSAIGATSDPEITSAQTSASVSQKNIPENASPESALPIYDFKQAKLYAGKRFALGVGVGIVKFDTNIKFIDKSSPLPPRYIDLEGRLDLPEISHVTEIYGAYSFNTKHLMMFSYFGVNRSSSLLNIDRDFAEGSINVKGDITLSDNTRFYNLTYGYNLFHDNRSHVTLVAGINGIDLKFAVNATGQITVGGQTKSSEKLAEANVFAPLPLIGLNFGFNFSPRWSMATKIALVAGTYQEISAQAVQTTISSRYNLTEHVGILLGMTYFSTSVDIDEASPPERTEVSYGYTGASAGMHFAF